MAFDGSQVELYIPKPSTGDEALDAVLRRRDRSIEDWSHSPFVTTAKIQNAVIKTAHIDDAQITNAHILDLSADKITAGTLQAAVLLAGIIRTADAGTRFEIDSAGIRAFNADEEQTLNIPAESGDITIKGIIEAVGLTVLGNMTLRGTDNRIEEGAAITMASGAGGTDPATGPQMASTWTKLALTGRSSGRGLHYDSTNTSYWTTEGLFLYEHNDDGTLIRSKAIPAGSGSTVDAVYGAVRVGTRVYVLCHEGSSPGTDAGYKIKVYSESSLTYLNQRNIGNFVGTVMGAPCIGDDGTNVIVCYLSSGGEIQFSKWTRADLPLFVSVTSSSGAGNPSADNPEFASLTGFAAAESKWWVELGAASFGIWDESIIGAKAFSTSGVFDADEEFTTGRRGLTEGSGSTFRSFDGGSVWTHTDWVWTTESPVYWCRYTWVDDNGAASVGARPLGAGDFESIRSPSNSITHKKRSTLQITTAAVPAGVSHVGFYLDRGSTEPTLDYVADVAATPGSPAVSNRTSFTSGGAAPPTTTTFPGGTGTDAEFRSEPTAGNPSGVPLLRANGFSRVKVVRTSALSIANTTETEVTWTAEVVDTDAYYTASGEIDIPFDGQYLVIARGQWASDTAGRRRITVQLDSGGGFTDTDIQHHDSLSGTAVTFASTATGILDALTGDQIKVRVFQSSGGALDLTSAQCSVLYLGPA